MFESLSTRLQGVLGALRGEVRLTPEVVESSLREIRLALLEADVNFKVTKAFINRVRDRAIDRTVLESLTPSQQVVAIVRDELLELFGESREGLSRNSKSLQVVLMVGLQGSGKTTTTAKLGRWLLNQGRQPLLVSADVHRPAAIEQLDIVGRDAGVRVHGCSEAVDAQARVLDATRSAQELGIDVVVVDTAGRLHVDQELMGELSDIREAVNPTDILYVADSMTGQDAVKSAGEFHHRISITGVILSKMDGDARGGAALSVVSVVGVPIIFAGTGERIDDLELFRPEGVVSRILGMGDVLSLVERAEKVVTRDDAELMATKLQRNEFTLGDLRRQIQAIGKMGTLDQLLDLIPGGVAKMPQVTGLDTGQLTSTVAIIDAMTPLERRKPAIINGSRRRRVARGSGTSVQDVNRLLKQFQMMKKLLKRASLNSKVSGKAKRRLSLRKAMSGFSGLGRTH